jgi:signal recognition particle receptor subunit beta
MNHQAQSKMLTIETKGDRTLFFDFLPLNLGKIDGFDVKIQLYAVPGQTIYEATRRLVLKGVDGLVFVADHLKVRHKDNMESFQDLRHNLLEHNLTLEKIPVILQFNKCDLVPTPIPTMTKEELEAALNRELNTEVFEAAAIKGIGVFETLKKISKRTIRHVATDKKIHDPESLIRNIESTIDELFKASQNIEIDPLTSEVKDSSQEETDLGFESAIDMEVTEVAEAASIEPGLPEHSVLVDTVKSHIKILDDCIGYILPIEKLLARTPGMEKLHHFQKNIKSRLEEQKKLLEGALTGDYEPSVDVRDYAAQRTKGITVR